MIVILLTVDLLPSLSKSAKSGSKMPKLKRQPTLKEGLKVFQETSLSIRFGIFFYPFEISEVMIGVCFRFTN